LSFGVDDKAQLTIEVVPEGGWLQFCRQQGLLRATPNNDSMPYYHTSSGNLCKLQLPGKNGPKAQLRESLMHEGGCLQFHR